MTTRFHIGADEWPGISKLVEECGEVLQLAGKLIANEGKAKHWDGQDLKFRLTEELGQLLAAITFVRVHAKLDPSIIVGQFSGKLALYEKWHNDQQRATIPPRMSYEIEAKLSESDSHRCECETCKLHRTWKAMGVV
jgi:hypothetical protein